MLYKYIVTHIFLFSLFVNSAWANPCQLCSANISRETFNNSENSNRLNLALQLQYDYKNDLYNEGEEVDSIDDELIATTLINLYGGWNFYENLILDLNVPIVSRANNYGTFEDRESNRDTTLGDVSALVRGIIFSNDTPEEKSAFSLRLGAKLPTGDDDLLKDGPLNLISSNIRGRDLATGSGSVDYIVGTNFFYDYGRLNNSFDLQYIFKTEGSGDYLYGNEFWAQANSMYALSTEANRLLVGVNAIYRQLDKDEYQDSKEDNTGSSMLFVGPSATLNLKDKFKVVFNYNLPVYVDSNGTQLLSAYILQASLVGKF
jgi:hypothetical protein